jgi:hypothetical protein
MYCKECGSQVPDEAKICMKCGVPTGVVVKNGQVRDIGQDPWMRILLPVGRSGYAIAAGYLGLLSLVIYPAPLALVFGILAVRHIKRDPTKHGMGRAVFGIIMGIIGTALLLFTDAASIVSRMVSMLLLP